MKIEYHQCVIMVSVHTGYPLNKCYTPKQSNYSQLSPCGHLAITDTPIIWTATKSPVKINYRRLTGVNFRHYGLSLNEGR